MKILLLCDYRPELNSESAVAQLQRQLDRLRDLELPIVAVISARAAEAQIPFLTDVEVVFDDTPSAHIASNLRAGAPALLGEPGLILPLEITCPKSEIWQALIAGWQQVHAQAQPADFVQMANWELGFPLLITPKGAKNLTPRTRESHPVPISLTDARWIYHRTCV